MLRTIKLIATLFVAIFTISYAHAETNPQVVCLAQTMYHEARGESDKGMIAVGNVVMNRTRSGRFPNTPCAVIKQRTRKSCQFSWVCSRNQIRELPLYNRAMQLARQVYVYNVDLTHGALFFHARTDRPRSSKLYATASIGKHTFYRG